MLSAAVPPPPTRYFSRIIGTKIKRLCRGVYRQLRKSSGGIELMSPEEYEEQKNLRRDGRLSKGCVVCSPR